MIIEAIVFDMDGLIFNSERVVQRSWEAVGNELGISKLGDHIYNTLGFNVVRRAKYFQHAFGEAFPMEEFQNRTRVKFQEIVSREGLEMKPGVVELMQYGKEKGLKMAVATSSRREYSTRLLSDAGLMQYLDGCVFGDSVKHAKPDPEIYLKACEMIGADPKKSLALEDSPAGIQSSHAAGMTPIMIPDLVQPGEEILPLVYCKMETLLEVIPFLEACETGAGNHTK